MNVTLQDILDDFWNQTGSQTGSSVWDALNGNMAIFRELVGAVKLLNRHVRTAWERFPWPDSINVECRLNSPPYSNYVAYPVDAIIFDVASGNYYQANTATTAGQSPANTPAVWTLYSAPPISASKEVLAVYSHNPLEYREARELKYKLIQNYVYVNPRSGSGNPTLSPESFYVWVKFQYPAPQFSFIPWSSGVYTAGQIVIYGGNSYVATTTTTAGNNPVTNTSSQWLLLPSPNTISAWASGSYAAGNFVTYNGNTYVCILAATTQAPSSATYWLLLAPYQSAFVWSSGIYTANQLVYFGTDTYMANSTTTAGQSPGSAPQYWNIQAVPQWLSAILVNAMVGDWLAAKGDDKAPARKAEADEMLSVAIKEISNDQQQANNSTTVINVREGRRFGKLFTWGWVYGSLPPQT